MKKMGIGCLIMAVVLMTALTGCGEKEKDTKKTQTQTQTEAEVRTEATTAVATEEKKVPADVTVEYYEEEIPQEDCLLINDSRYEESEYRVPLLISTDQKITDVKLAGVEMGTVTEEITKFFINHEIYDLDELTPDQPILLNTEFPNLMPTLALSYTDTDGEKKVFSIAMSGKDSSLVVEPAEFEE